MDYQELLKPDIEDIEEMKEIKKDKTRIAVTIAIIILFVLFSIIAGIIRLSHTELVSGYNKPALEEFVQDVYADKINEKIGGDSNLTFDEITTIIANMVSQELSKTNMFTGPQLSEMETLIEERINAAGPGTADPQVVKEITTLVEKQYETNYTNMDELHKQVQALMDITKEVSPDRYDELKKADDELKSWLTEAEKGLDAKFAERDKNLAEQEKAVEEKMDKLEKAIEEYNQKSAELSQQLKNIENKPGVDTSELETRIALLETALGKTNVAVQSSVNFTTINNINNSISEINKSLKQYNTDQKTSDEKLKSLIDGLDTRLKDLEQYKNDAEAAAKSASTTQTVSSTDISNLQTQINDLSDIVNGTKDEAGNVKTKALKAEIKDNKTELEGKLAEISQKISQIKCGYDDAAKQQMADNTTAIGNNNTAIGNNATAIAGNKNEIEVLKKYLKITNYDKDKTYSAGDMVIKNDSVDGQGTSESVYIAIAGEDGTISWEKADYSAVVNKLTELENTINAITANIGDTNISELVTNVESLENTCDTLNLLIKGNAEAKGVIDRLAELEKLTAPNGTIDEIQAKLKSALKSVDAIEAYLDIKAYEEGKLYEKDDIVVYGGNVYICNESTSETPSADSAQWSLSEDLNKQLSKFVDNDTLTERVETSTQTIMEKLSYEKYNPAYKYPQGSYVLHEGKIYVSLVNDPTQEPGVAPSIGQEPQWQETDLSRMIADYNQKIESLMKENQGLDEQAVNDLVSTTVRNMISSNNETLVKKDEINNLIKNYIDQNNVQINQGDTTNNTATEPTPNTDTSTTTNSNGRYTYEYHGDTHSLYIIDNGQ